MTTQMRKPKTWNDKGLLEDEPFRSEFEAYALVSGTSRKATMEINQRLRAMAANLEGGTYKAARRWAQLAFAKRTNRGLDEDMRNVFVQFYWKLYRKYRNDDSEEATLYISEERRKRGFDTTIPNPFEAKIPSENTTSTSQSKKPLHGSHRVSTVNKKQVLGKQAQAGPTIITKKAAVTAKKVATRAPAPRSSRHGRAGFEGKGLPLRGSNKSLKVQTITDPSAPCWSSHSSVSPRRARRNATVPPVLKTHSLPRPDSVPCLPVLSSSGRAMGSGDEAGASPVETGCHALGMRSADRHFAPTIPTDSSESQTSASMETSDAHMEKQPSIVKAEIPPNQPELHALLLQHDKSGVVNLEEPPQLLNGPLSAKAHAVGDPLDSSLGYFQSSVVERLLPCMDMSPPRIQNNPYVATSAQIPTPRHIPFSIPTNLFLQAKDREPHGLMSPGPEELDAMMLCNAEQNQSFHDLEVVSQNKPPLPNYPLIWAQSRQEVCESFDWFRSYQGGVYHVRDHAKGYLLSAFSSSRDLFQHDGRLIISHGGGKAESIHSHQGRLAVQPPDDQLAQDKSVRALLTNYKESRPLVLLIDDKYALFPYDLRGKDIVYAVLGFYTITHVWAEYQPANNELGRVVRYKFAFQWCEGQGEPWWIPYKDEPMAVSGEAQFLSSSIPATTTISLRARPPTKTKERKLSDPMPLRSDGIYFTCPVCSHSIPKVYQQGWACLNPTCPGFWTTPGRGCLPFQLNYNRDFLRLSSPYMLPPNLRDIRPNPPESSSHSITTTYAFTRGLHCKQCGRLSCRDNWAYWECRHCKTRVGATGRLRLPKEFWNEKLPVSFLDHSIHAGSEITKKTIRLFGHGKGLGQIQTFVLPYGRGRIHHIQSVTPEGKRAADAIFEEYQEDASTGRLLFRRWPMRAHKCRGPLLTNYFSQNSGEPYQYVGGTDNTVPFSETSSAVKKARDLIQERIFQALGMRSGFNEVLSAAYMERQKMAFHSDSERGLGPLVAGLSLGAPALMHFRVHHKYFREHEVGHKTLVLTIIIRHGDVLVMDGAGVQENYEHTVVPTNFRIAATARKIDVQPRAVEDVTMAVPNGIKLKER